MCVFLFFVVSVWMMNGECAHVWNTSKKVKTLDCSTAKYFLHFDIAECNSKRFCYIQLIQVLHSACEWKLLRVIEHVYIMLTMKIFILHKYLATWHLGGGLPACYCIVGVCFFRFAWGWSVLMFCTYALQLVCCVCALHENSIRQYAFRLGCSVQTFRIEIAQLIYAKRWWHCLNQQSAFKFMFS